MASHRDKQQQRLVTQIAGVVLQCTASSRVTGRAENQVRIRGTAQARDTSR